MPRINIPDYEPDKDLLILEVNGQEYTFCADNEVLSRIAKENASIDENDQEAQMRSMPRLLQLGLEKRHPELTIDDITAWFDSPRRIKAFGDAIAQYMQTDQVDEEGNLVT